MIQSFKLTWYIWCIWSFDHLDQLNLTNQIKLPDQLTNYNSMLQ
jgi:hypothetical protein